MALPHEVVRLAAGMHFAFLDQSLTLPDLLDETGHLKLLRAAEYDAFPPQVLQLWCNRHARYGVPTVELIEWLRPLIAERRTIEIGAGNGDLAHHLGIPATDSWIMTNPTIAAHYRRFGQPVIDYPPTVERLDAAAAIEKYQPEIVLASWVTQWIDPHLAPPEGGGSIFGVKEDRLLATGATYIFIGNLAVHGHKVIRKLPHIELALPFLRSRTFEPALDRVMIWNGDGLAFADNSRTGKYP